MHAARSGISGMHGVMTNGLVMTHTMWADDAHAGDVDHVCIHCEGTAHSAHSYSQQAAASNGKAQLALGHHPNPAMQAFGFAQHLSGSAMSGSDDLEALIGEPTNGSCHQLCGACWYVYCQHAASDSLAVSIPCMQRHYAADLFNPG